MATCPGPPLARPRSARITRTAQQPSVMLRRSISATLRSKFDPVRRWGREGPSPTAIARNSRSQTCVETPVSSCLYRTITILQRFKVAAAWRRSCSERPAPVRREGGAKTAIKKAADPATRGRMRLPAVDNFLREDFNIRLSGHGARWPSRHASRVNWCVLFAEPPPCPLGPATTHHPSTASTHSHDPRRPSCSQLMTMPRGPEPGSSKLPGGCECARSRG